MATVPHHHSHPGSHHSGGSYHSGSHHHGGRQAASHVTGSLAVRVLAASAGLRIAMVLPAVALLWAAVAWALLSEG